MLFFYFLCMLLPLFIFAHKERYSYERNTLHNRQIYEPRAPSPIVGGHKVTKQKWRWMVSLTEYSNHTHFCGGSIISSSWIVTAAHCLSNRHLSGITVNAGSIYYHHSTQRRRIAQNFSHLEFDSETNVNDIALLLLSSPLDMNDRTIAKIDLPSERVLMDDYVSASEYPPVNSYVTAIGWGKTAEDATVLSQNLQEVTLNTIAYESDSCHPLIASKERQFCAGVHTGEKDTCQGDSGGPLMKQSSSGKWILAGVTSGGYGCAQVGSAGVYTRVALYVDWINGIISSHERSHSPVVTERNKISSTTFDDSEANTCSRYHPSPLPLMVLSIYFSVYFM